jgi:DNA polymerase III subunit delta'
MKLVEIKGQDRVIDALIRSISAHRVAHAYLFEGPAGCGKRTTALALIQALFCKESLDGDACGNCSSCRKFVSGNHPDLHLLQPLPDKRDISIEQIRELQHALALRPFEAGRKACLIEPAERMNEKSANALLKTLEEPSGHAIIILLAVQADSLLSTIRSRCQHLHFSPLDDVSVATLLVLQGMESEKASEMASLAEGSMERAQDLEEASDCQRRQELLELLSQVSTERIGSVFDFCESLSGGRDETIETFNLLVSLIRDLMLACSAGQVGITNRFLQNRLEAEACRFTPAGAIRALELALESRQSVLGNANGKLALEHFLLGYDRLRKGA